LDQHPAPFDLAIVGAGIAGVLQLLYARRAGLSAVVLEREAGAGGLWRQLPAWQDIQVGQLDWALGDVPLAGAAQPHILANIQGFVDHFGLADGIRFGTPVRTARHGDAGWTLETPDGAVRARHLVAATGAHNVPLVPAAVERREAHVQELHSSALREPSMLAGRTVVVVGGGASAFDLLDLCLEHGAGRIVWVHRGVKWFVPTRQPKHLAGSVRGFARLQESGMTIAQQNAALNTDMAGRYEKFGLQALRPPRPFDVQQDQLMPGRARMLANLGAIERHVGSVAAIEGGTVVLSDGERIDADLLLWGTGYAVDLGWLDVPALASVRSVNELAARCGCVFRSLDAPDLYFPGVGLDGIGSGPWDFALIARSIASHVAGTAQLDMEPLAHKVNHFDLVRYLAARDSGSFPPGWEAQYRALALEWPEDRAYPLP
jgi:cation diffusion facilitator CzcD-associated flavoprotein CzcO